MSFSLRVILGVVVVVAQLGAADREQFTLKDGRILVGTYDEVSQTLNIESPKASMHVDQRDILKREDAPDPVAPKPKVEAKVEAKATTGSLPSYAANVTKLQDAAKAASALARQYDEAAQKAEHDLSMAWEDAAEEFLESADLTPITINVPQNPTQGDLTVAQQKRQFNEALARIAEDKKDPKRKKIRAHMIGVVQMGGRDFFEQYGEWKGPAWVGEVLGRRQP